MPSRSTLTVRRQGLTRAQYLFLLSHQTAALIQAAGAGFTPDPQAVVAQAARLVDELARVTDALFAPQAAPAPVLAQQAAAPEQPAQPTAPAVAEGPG